MPNAINTPRLTVYNFVRRFTGPVFAHRVAFRLGGVHHG